MTISTHGRIAGALVILGTSLLVASAAAAGTGPRLTRAQFDTKAKQACMKAGHELAAVPHPGPTAASLATTVRGLARVESKEVGVLERLKPPVSIVQAVHRGLQLKRQTVRAERSVASRLLKGTVSLEKASVELMNLPNGAAFWRKAGAPVCAFD